MDRKHVYYSGNVQGVGFRYRTRQIAANHNVSGYAKNLFDGRVELVVEGKKKDIQTFLAEIADYMGGYIRETQIQDEQFLNEFSEFDIRF